MAVFVQSNIVHVLIGLKIAEEIGLDILLDAITLLLWSTYILKEPLKPFKVTAVIKIHFTWSYFSLKCKSRVQSLFKHLSPTRTIPLFSHIYYADDKWVRDEYPFIKL